MIISFYTNLFKPDKKVFNATKAQRLKVPQKVYLKHILCEFLVI
jgi:hypothetical protein